MNAVTDAARKCIRVHRKSPRESTVDGMRDLGLDQTPLYECLFQDLVWELWKHTKHQFEGEGKSLENFKQRLGKVKQDFVVLLLAACLEFTYKPFDCPYTEVGCHYHDHSDGSSCGTSTT